MLATTASWMTTSVPSLEDVDMHTIAAHRLWAGVALTIAATALLVLTDGGWAIALMAAFGVLLMLMSFAKETT